MTYRLVLSMLVVALVMAFSGCHRQKPVVLLPKEPPPAAAPADTANAQQPPATTTTQPSEQQPSQPSAQEQPAATTTTATANKPAKPASHRHNGGHKPSPEHPVQEKPADKPAQEAKNNPPQKIIIQNGGSSNSGSGQISPGGSASSDNATTGELLDGAEKNLNSLKRQLSSSEQAMVTQIRDFMAQSRQAIKDGDMTGAHNLAFKAHQLSDELLKEH